MKKSFAMLLCVAVGLLLAGAAMAFTGSYTPGAGINLTPHDIPNGAGLGAYAPSPETAGGPANRICIYCHAPHHTYRLSTSLTGTGTVAPADYTYLPLWNHAVTTQGFTPYNSGPDAPTVGAKATQSMTEFVAIGASSLLCLSCHDGTVAVNQYGSAPQDPKSISNQTGTGARIANQYKIGDAGNLSNHHPIGFNYANVATADAEIYSATTATFNIVGGLTPVSKTVDNFLYGGKMECATCHAVHNTGNSGEKLLYVSDKSSNLCLSCHAKGTKVAP